MASSMEERVREATVIIAKDSPKVHSKKVTPKKKEENVIRNIDAKSTRNIIFSKIFMLKNSLYLIISIRNLYMVSTFVSTIYFFSKRLWSKHSRTS